MTWWMWLVLAGMIPIAQTLAETLANGLIVAVSAIDRFDETPKVQLSAVLGHVPGRGTDAAGDGGRGEDAAAGACPATQSRD